VKAILLASASGLLLFALVTVSLRHIKTNNRVRILGILFGAVLPLLICVHLITPSNLGFLGAGAQLSTPGLDLLFALFLYLAGFFGGILQLYNLADRGFSLRMLIDILQAPSGVMTVDDMMTGYGGGRGIIWMYDKRIRDMIYNGLVTECGDNLVLTGRGLRLARIYRTLRKAAHTEHADAP
jgi:hypothetical protein